MSHRIPCTYLIFVWALGLLRCFQTSNEADVSWTASRATKPDSGTRPPTPDWASTSPFAPNVPNEAFTSMTRPSPNYRIYHNLWFHNMKWYAFLPADEADDPSIEDGLSPNAVVIRMPITDLRNYTRQLRMSYVSGNSALLDLTFQAYPSHLGHWLELMVPLYSVLREGDWAHYCKGSSADLDHVVTPNVAEYYSSWAAKAFLVTLKPSRDNGNKVDQIDYGDLMGVDKLSWILFENVLVLQDRYTHPQRKVGFIGPEHGDLWRYDGCDRWVSSTFVPSFWSQESGQAFRRMAYEAAPWDIPEPWTPGSPPPKREYMTLLLNADDEPNVYNRVELTELIHELAEEFGLKGRVVSLTNEAPFVSHLETVANSAVLVARHSSLLASTVFMPPGSMVLELLPFKWEWHKLSMMYFNLTQSIGDIHHFGWRPTDVKYAVYKNDSSRFRYKDWFPGECHARECLSVQGSADVVVDLDAVTALLRSKVPGMLAGRAISDLAEPWPEAV